MMKFSRTVRVMVLVLALALMMPVFASADAIVAKAAKPSKVILDTTEKTVLPGETFVLAASVLPENASQRVTWKSSNKSIATVSSTGRVTALKKGKVKITATTKTGNKKATCNLTVSQNFAGVDVHFYGIGNGHYQNSRVSNLLSCIEDVKNMELLYASSSFGGKAANVHRHTDLTAAGIISVLNTMVNDPNIDEDDITVFYYTGHGCGLDYPGTYHGALTGVETDGTVNSANSGLVSVDVVQSYLDRVKGTVVVILDSCFSGQFIKYKGAASASLAASARAANDAWTKALSSSRATNFTTKALPDSPVRTKYRILTAASNNQVSVGFEPAGTSDEPPFGLFTAYYTYYMNNMKLDNNKDRVVSLHEAYKLLTKGLENFKKDYNRGRKKEDQIEQVLCVWPKNNAFPIYARN